MATLTDMTRAEAINLMEDLGKNLSLRDYVDNIYISIKDVGTRVFRNCAYFEAEEYTFIWTHQESFLMDKNEMGDFVVVPYEHNSQVSLEKAI